MNIYTVDAAIGELLAGMGWDKPIITHPIQFVTKDDLIDAEDLGVQIAPQPIKRIGNRTRMAFVLIKQYGSDSSNPEDCNPVLHYSQPMSANEVAIAFILACSERLMRNALQKQEA